MGHREQAGITPVGLYSRGFRLHFDIINSMVQSFNKLAIGNWQSVCVGTLHTVRYALFMCLIVSGDMPPDGYQFDVLAH